jgi:hypothetical protein
MKANMGTLTKVGDEFVLEVEGERYPVPGSLLANSPELERLVGEKVEVMLSVPKPFVVAIRKIGRPPILCYLRADLLQVGHWMELGPARSDLARQLRLRPTCYVPADWMIRGVEEQVRKNLATQMLEDGIISQEVYEQIIG